MIFLWHSVTNGLPTDPRNTEDVTSALPAFQGLGNLGITDWGLGMVWD